jgi:hypothetical protein
MKNLTIFISLCLMLVLTFSTGYSADFTSTGSGNWSATSTWSGGAVPTGVDNVTILDGHTITLDGATATCNNLTIGQGSHASLQTSKTLGVAMTVNGDITIAALGRFAAQTNTTGGTGLAHTLDLKGNLTHNGDTLDLRAGTSGTTLSVINLTLSGISNSTLTVNTAYSSTNGDFNYITINKTGGAKVILGSKIICSGGSGTGLPACNSGITFTSGIVETGSYYLAYQGSTAAQVVGYSSTSYVNGSFARGMSNSAGAAKEFPVGDANVYRLVYVRSTTAGTTTGHLVIVKCVPGNANTGSILNGGIDKVSEVRYYVVTYDNTIGGAASMSFDLFKLSYATDDYVGVSNTDLRVAYSTDSRVNWNGIAQTTPLTTTITDPPTQITPDALTSPVTLTAGSTNTMFLTLARATGTITNPLPIQLASFIGSYIGNSAKLEWSTISEVNNYGFNVQRLNEANKNYETVGFVAGKSTTLEPQSYSFLDSKAGTSYRLEQIDNNGLKNYFGPIMLNPNSASDKSVPAVFALNQNYPNPFNPSTKISFSLANAEYTTMKIYNMLGKEVATLFSGNAEAGRLYTVNFDAKNLTSGLYFSKLVSGNSVEVRKMSLVK